MTYSLTENQFSGKTYFYAFASLLLPEEALTVVSILDAADISLSRANRCSDMRWSTLHRVTEFGRINLELIGICSFYLSHSLPDSAWIWSLTTWNWSSEKIREVIHLWYAMSNDISSLINMFKKLIFGKVSSKLVLLAGHLNFSGRRIIL